MMEPEHLAHAVAASTPWTYEEALDALRWAGTQGLLAEVAAGNMIDAWATWRLRQRDHSIRTGLLRRDLRRACPGIA